MCMALLIRRVVVVVATLVRRVVGCVCVVATVGTIVATCVAVGTAKWRSIGDMLRIEYQWPLTSVHVVCRRSHRRRDHWRTRTAVVPEYR